MRRRLLGNRRRGETVEIRDIENFSYSGSTSPSLGTNAQGFCFNSNGTKIFFTGTAFIRQYSLPTPYNIEVMNLDYTFTMTGWTNRGININNDDSKLFLTTNFDNIFYLQEIDLVEPDDLSSAVIGNGLNLGGVYYDVDFSDDGLTALLASVIYPVNDSHTQYVLTTGFDVTTGSLDYTSPPYGNKIDQFPYKIMFFNNGFSILIGGSSANRTYQVDLLERFDVKGIDFSASNVIKSILEMGSEGAGDIRGLKKNKEETSIFTLKSNGFIYRYNL